MLNGKGAFQCERNADDSNTYARLDRLKMSRKNIARFTQLLNKDKFEFDIVKGKRAGQIVFSIDVTKECRNKKALGKLMHTLKKNLNKNQHKDIEDSILNNGSSELVKELLACYNNCKQDVHEKDDSDDGAITVNIDYINELFNENDDKEGNDDEKENDDKEENDETDETSDEKSSSESNIEKEPVKKVNVNNQKGPPKLSKAEQKLMEKEKKSSDKDQKCYDKVQKRIKKQRETQETNREKNKIELMKCQMKSSPLTHGPNNFISPNIEEEADYEELKKLYEDVKFKLNLLEEDKKSAKNDSSRPKKKVSFDKNKKAHMKSKSNKDSSMDFLDDIIIPDKAEPKSSEKKARDTSSKPKKKVDKKQKPDKNRSKKSPKESKPKNKSKSKDAKREKSPKKVKTKTKEKPKGGKSKDKKKPKNKKEKNMKVNYALVQETQLTDSSPFLKPEKERTKDTCNTLCQVKITPRRNVRTTNGKDEKKIEISELKPNELETDHNNRVSNKSKSILRRKMVTKSERYDYIPVGTKYSSEQVICSESLNTLESIVL